MRKILKKTKIGISSDTFLNTRLARVAVNRNSVIRIERTGCGRTDPVSVTTLES